MPESLKSKSPPARAVEPAPAAPAATVKQATVEAVARGEHSDPFNALGPHTVERDAAQFIAIRAFLPRAKSVSVVAAAGEKIWPAERLHPAGFFEALVPAESLPASADGQPPAYRLRVEHYDGATEEIADPYAFPPLLTDYDLHLISEGTHYQKYEKLGAHLREVRGVRGLHFGVWAPNARRVSVVGDFNHWDGRAHAMRPRGRSGVWEVFLPELSEGLIYKFEILSRVTNEVMLKADPYGFHAESRPKSGSVVFNIDKYKWRDAEWMERRARANHFEAPVSIYEVHLGSWRRTLDNHWLTYRDLAEQLIAYVKDIGCTHIELLPVMEHPFDGSWGYQTLGYFAATSRFGAPDDLMFLIDRAHQDGIGVILDWTPAHFPRDAHGLGLFDGTHLYEHADPRQGAHPDWGTLVFNYGRNEVQNYLISNALFWMDKYHVDGLRVDAVASMLYLDYSRAAGEWLPNEYGGRENLAAIAFIKRMNEVIHARHSGVLTFAEESTAWPQVSRPTYLGGLGFDFKWNMGWMHDTLRYFSNDPVHRKYQHSNMTFSMLYAFTENFVLPFSHDEVVHGKRALISKMPGDMWQQFANLRLLYGYMFGHPGKKLLFMGSEFGQWIEWNHDKSLDWHLLDYATHRGVQALVRDLNQLYASQSALHQVDFDWRGFEWIDCHDADNSILSFIRRANDPDDFIVVVCNCTPVVRQNYRVGVPQEGFYAELLNTDAGFYGGSNVGNSGGVSADPVHWNGRPYSLKLTLPPLAALFLKLRRV